MTVGVENEFTALSALFKEKYFSARLLNFESIPPNHDAWVVLFAASFLYANLNSGIRNRFRGFKEHMGSEKIKNWSLVGGNLHQMYTEK